MGTPKTGPAGAVVPVRGHLLVNVRDGSGVRLASRPIKNVRQQRATKRDGGAFPKTATVKAFAQVAPEAACRAEAEEPNATASPIPPRGRSA
jgi:hypothetical protein